MGMDRYPTHRKSGDEWGTPTRSRAFLILDYLILKK